MSYAETAQFVATPARGDVSAALVRPAEARAALVLAHGAGAGIHHPFMTRLSQELAGRGVATFRYQFPYMEAGRRAPDRPPALVETVRAAVRRAAGVLEGLPLFAGGKSMGGRMTSTAAAEAPLPGVAGIVFFGFPLHRPGRPSTGRGDHLTDVDVPLLFLQGPRDRLADLELLRPLLDGLGGRATLHVVEGADHSFKVLKRSGRTEDDVFDELAARTASWIDDVIGRAVTPA